MHRWTEEVGPRVGLPRHQEATMGTSWTYYVQMNTYIAEQSDPFLEKPKEKIDVCKTLMPPFPTMWRVDLTSDLALWPTNLNFNRDHLLIKDYLPTKFEASR